jgi:hypothetical protein
VKPRAVRAGTGDYCLYGNSSERDKHANKEWAEKCTEYGVVNDLCNQICTGLCQPFRANLKLVARYRPRVCISGRSLCPSRSETPGADTSIKGDLANLSIDPRSKSSPGNTRLGTAENLSLARLARTRWAHEASASTVYPKKQKGLKRKMEIKINLDTRVQESDQVHRKGSQ